MDHVEPTSTRYVCDSTRRKEIDVSFAKVLPCRFLEKRNQLNWILGFVNIFEQKSLQKYVPTKSFIWITVRTTNGGNLPLTDWVPGFPSYTLVKISF